MEIREHALKAFQASVPEHKAQLALELQSGYPEFVVDAKRHFTP